MGDYIKTILIKDIVIEGSKLNKNINDTILKILKNNVEDKCLDKGFVKKDSVKIIKRSAGMFSGSLFNGSVKFNVVFSCELCHPNKGDILNCKVLRVNELGVRGLIGPIKVTVAKQFQDNKSIFKDIKEGDMIEVVVLDKKFDLNNKFIQVAAKIDEDKLFKNMQKIEENKVSKKNKNLNKIVLSSLESLEGFTNNNVNINDIAEELEISDSDELDDFYGTDETELEEEKIENNENVLSYENITGKDNVNLQTTNIDINADNPNEQEVIASEESEEEELEESEEDAESDEEPNVESEEESFDMEKDEESDLDEIQYSENDKEENEDSTEDEEIDY